MTPNRTPEYRLDRSTSGGALLGLSVPQLFFLAAGVASIVLLPTTTRSAAGLLAGAGLAAGCTVAAFGRIGAEPVYTWVLILSRFVLHRTMGRTAWMAPLPLLTGTPPNPASRHTNRHQSEARRRRTATLLPACLRGLELVTVPRPLWAGAEQTLTPIGLVRDRRRETLTVLMNVRGGGFALREPAEQHAAMQVWGQVLAQFGRESSPVIRLGWTLYSAPIHPGRSDGHLEWLAGHSNDALRLDAVRAAYAIMLTDTVLQRHELRIWITVAAGSMPTSRRERHQRPSTRGVRPGPADAALAAAKALSDRCAAAGLTVSPPLSPVQIAEATRIQADPTIAPLLASLERGLAQHAGIASTQFMHNAHASLNAKQPPPTEGTVGMVQAGPMAIAAHWDCVHVDGVWHRAFWVSHWPGTITDPGWLHPLLTGCPGIRTLAVSYEPIAPRVSRRKITAEAVSVNSQLQLRERHELRVPVDLQHAHQDIDQRESELAAGHAEVGLLALIVLTNTSRERLDDDSQTLLDQAAQIGVTDLRPLHARHDAAWACTLPLGRVPDHEILQGLTG